MKLKSVSGSGKVVLSVRIFLSVSTEFMPGNPCLTPFAASKVFHSDYTYEKTMAAVKESIVNLGYCRSCTYLFICMWLTRRTY